jgi:iron transport multicopper oxidase
MVSTDRASSIQFSSRSVSEVDFRCSAVLPGGTFPGTVIRGNKGDRFQINVVDHLTDATMLRSTSIVRYNFADFVL